MSAQPEAASADLFRHPPLLLFVGSRSVSEFAYQIATVAIGWQVYALTGSAVYLGMVGLVQFIPSALLVFIAGHAADRYDRRRVVQACQLIQGLGAAYLGWRSFAGDLNVPEIFAVLITFGVASAFGDPAASALLPAVAPEGHLQRATALSTGAWQIAIVAGPAIGGFAYAISPVVPYAVMAAFWLLAAILAGAIGLERPAAEPDPPSLPIVRRRQIRPRQSGDPRHHFARSVRGTARRRQRAAADLCAGHP